LSSDDQELCSATDCSNIATVFPRRRVTRNFLQGHRAYARLMRLEKGLNVKRLEMRQTTELARHTPLSLGY